MFEKDAEMAEEEYKNLSQKKIEHYCDKTIFVTGFLAGLKAGRPQWHDLLKDKNDLPKLDKTDMSDYVITDKGVAYYNGRVKSWYIQNEYILSDDVIAWCEIPTFDKE